MAERDTEYLNKDEHFRRVRLIGGAYASMDIPSIVGYCHNEAHKGIITITIMNEHDCLAKGCHYFEKFEDYPFWQKRQRREELKQLKKLKRKRSKENKARCADNIRKTEEMLISHACMIADKLGFDNFRIISIHKTGKEYTIFYISDVPENDWYDFREIAFAMNGAFHKKFTLKHAKLPDGSYAVI